MNTISVQFDAASFFSSVSIVTSHSGSTSVVMSLLRRLLLLVGSSCCLTIAVREGRGGEKKGNQCYNDVKLGKTLLLCNNMTVVAICTLYSLYVYCTWPVAGCTQSPGWWGRHFVHMQPIPGCTLYPSAGPHCDLHTHTYKPRNYTVSMHSCVKTCLQNIVTRMEFY